MEATSPLPETSGAVTVNREDRDEFEEDEKVKDEEDYRYFTSNRWPQQETLALLKIRSEMDAEFRDTNLKAPLWEEVSRKLAELGYSRSAKKCKEKFENIYKYHRRTKEGRSGRPNGKNYRFFEQLEALENSNGLLSSPSPEKDHPYMAAATVSPASFVPNYVSSSIHSPVVNSVDATSPSTTYTSSEESEGTRRKKRKLTDFIGSLMQQVIDRQESWQKKFLEIIEKCEQDRMAREEAWKAQELERKRREQELLAQDRSIAAAKDAAVLAFLQKFTEQNGSVQLFEDQTFSMLLPDHDNTVPVQFPQNQVSSVENLTVPIEKVSKTQETSGTENFVGASSSRWPKAEIEALIALKSNLDLQCQKDGPKGVLWEEISIAMKKLGYGRSAKRCKEKWENMNKYFRRVKESNKRRPGDAKTCPYFNQLDALYREKSKIAYNSVNPGVNLKPEELLMHMMVGQGQQEQPGSATTEEQVDQNQENDTQKDDQCRLWNDLTS